MTHSRPSLSLASILAAMIVGTLSPALAGGAPCVVPDNATGTVDLPPAGCGYVSPNELHVIIDGLPPGTEINISPEHSKFFNVNRGPGGNLGGEIERFDSQLILTMNGTGALGGFARFIAVPIFSEVHTGPRNPGDPVQSFSNDMFLLQGEIFGDPDFDTLRVRAGTNFGLPSPGQTTLTDLGDGTFNVDSFFDITYEIEFVGAPGSILEGFAGTTQGSVRMQAGLPEGACPPIPQGQDAFPSTAKLVVQSFDGGAEPFVLRLSSAGLPDTIVERGPEVGNNGDATIPTEIVSMSLQGFHPNLGQVQVFEDPGQPSLGAIVNIQKDGACEFVAADSFFDVFVLVDLPDLGLQLRSEGPIRVERRPLRTLPPKDERYENPFVNPVVLVDVSTRRPWGQILYHQHHVDPPLPPPGSDCFETFIDLDANIPALGFNGRLFGSGPTTVRRGAPLSFGFCQRTPTQTCSSDADCPAGETCQQFSQIETEIMQMDLTGNDPMIGTFQLRESPAQPSPGQVLQQQPNRTFPADSFFDVFVELDVQGMRLHTPEPVQVFTPPTNPLTNLPPDPGTPWVSPAGLRVPLLLEDGQPVGDISNIVHTVGPPIDWQPPPPADDDCFDSWIELEITIFNPFCTEQLFVPGQFRIMRDDPRDPSGLGLELIDALMAKVRFDGESSCFGPFTLALNGDRESRGMISSLAPDEFFPADSFFDVFFDVDTGIGRLHNEAGSHMTTTINELPPESGEIYFGPGTVIPIFDDAGRQIGEILEVSHQVHQQIVCPAACQPFIEFPTPNSDDLDVGIPGGGGGVLYDVVRGDLGVLRSTGGLFPASAPFCLQDNGSPALIDGEQPGPGGGFYYLSRDGFQGFVGTYDNAARDVGLGGICP